MPVFAEIVHNPPEQDLKDLRLIYETGDGPLPDWLQSALDGDGLLISGRFNSRLLGAFYLSPAGDGAYQLQRLQVRELTRRRGVARQLLQLALRKLPPEVQSIEADLGEHPELAALFTEVGFEASGQHYRWSAPA